MSLIGNGIRLASNPARFGVSATAIYTQKKQEYGARKNFFIGEHASLSTRINGSQPSGYGHPYCWLWAIKAGGLTCRNVIEGTSSLTAEMYSGKDLSADLVGDGFITSADLALSTGLSADLAGTGTVSADMVGIVQFAADLTGTGTISSAPLDMLAGLSAGLSGVGTISANATGIAELSADITVTASVDFPTADDITTAVWAKIIESGYTAEQILKLLSAVHLGTSSGFPTSPVFKGLDGSTDRVSGGVDSNGNRTSVTLNP